MLTTVFACTPSSDSDSTEPSATSHSTSTIPTAPGAETSIAPSTPPPTAAQSEASWPPEIIFTPLKEAGSTTFAAGKFTIEIPSGFVAESEGHFVAPTASGAAATISITAAPSPEKDASAQLSELAQDVASIDIQNAQSAAVGRKLTSDMQTWFLAVMTADVQIVNVALSAPPDEFDALLLPNSLGSVTVAP